MQKNKGRAKKIFKFLFKAGVTCAYVVLVAVLILQALKPGSESSAASNDFGDKLDSVVTQISKPQAQIKNAESVEIIALQIGNKTFDEQPFEIKVGSSGKIKCEVLPEDATDKAVIYSSSDDEVVKVYADGKVVAKSAGQAEIEVALKSNDKLKDSIVINVVEIAIESLQITNLPASIHVGQQHRLEAQFEPRDTTQKKLKWSSSDKTVATVDSSGKITAKAEGTVTITAKSAFDNSIFATTQLHVLPKLVLQETPVETIVINTPGQKAFVGKSLQLSVDFYPSDSKDSIVWATSDETIATVSQKGVVKFLKAGNVNVTASCTNYDKSATTSFVVGEVLSSKIVLQTTDIDNQDGNFVLKQGESGKVVALLDEDATVLDIVFSSSDSSVAQISQDGTIVALKGGTTTIFAKTSYNGNTVSQQFTLVVNKITFAETVNNFYLFVRKGFGHFGAFLVLGIFATMTYYMAFAKSTKGKIIGFVVCLFAGFAVAGITEILQLPIFTAGRTSSFSDVMLDFKGYCCSSLVIYAIIFVVHFSKMIANKIKNGKNLA